MKESYLSVRALSVSYLRAGHLFRRRHRVVEQLSFEVAAGRAFGLVGESGSGKSTVARAILGLAHIDHGSVTVGRFTRPGLSRLDRKAFAAEVQAVFQDPYLSLNPRLSVATILEEPMAIQGVPRRERRQRLARVLARVRLPDFVLDQRPSRLSGGQRQRVCIARALVVTPRLLIADEPVSALDLSVQAGIIDLLAELKEEGLTLLFVSHDLELVQFIADEVGVLYAGRLVEVGPAARLFRSPAHPYTRLLLESTPARMLAGETPSGEGRRPAALQGCPYHPSCPLADMRCQLTCPPLTMVELDHRAACYKASREEMTG